MREGPTEEVTFQGRCVKGEGYSLSENRKCKFQSPWGGRWFFKGAARSCCGWNEMKVGESDGKWD